LCMAGANSRNEHQVDSVSASARLKRAAVRHSRAQQMFCNY
jgi:hypothetical protein